MKKYLSVIIVIFLLIISLASVKAASGEAYYICTNPSDNLATGVNVSWHSDIPDAFVEYTTIDDVNYLNSAKIVGESRVFQKQKNEDGYLSDGFEKSRYVCYAEIRNLSPDTKYMYRVGKTTFSKNYYFNTAIESDSFSFLHITDPQYGSLSAAGYFNDLMTRAYGIEPEIGFTLFTGDIVDRGGREYLWEYFFVQNNISKTLIATIPGNHEYYDNSGSPLTWNNDYYNAFYRNAQNGPEAILNSSYYFRYNNALFVMIDTEHKAQSYNTAWFRDVMEANTDADFIIVGMHRSFYGSTYANDSITIRSLWQRLFDTYGVDLVLSGHDHIYARSHSIYNDQISDDPLRGTTYIIGGFGGIKSYPAKANEKYAKVHEATRCANIITVSQDSININLINSSGTTIDTTTINKKRVGTKDDNFGKEVFLESIVVEVDEKNKGNATISWANNAFRNVSTIQLYKEQYSFVAYEIHLYHESFNSLYFKGLNTKGLNEYRIKVLFPDNTSSEISFTIDNRIIVPVVKIYISDVLAQIQEKIIKQINKVIISE